MRGAAFFPAPASFRAAALLALSVLAACTDGPPQPEKIPLDTAHCAKCGMIISADPGSAQVVSAGREPRFYDDLGCLAADQPAWQDGGTPFVQVENRGWMRAEAAYYARPPGARTTMDYGFVAYPDAASARSGGGAGPPLNWNDLLAAVAQEKPS